jgi:hypothetical protein
LCLRCLNKERSIFDKSILPRSRLEYYLAIWLGLCGSAWMIGTNYGEILTSYREARTFIILILGVLGWITCTYASFMFVRWETRMRQYLIWLIGGFVVSSLVLLPWYWHGYLSLSSQSIGIWQSVTAIWSRTTTNPWYLVVLFFLVCLILVLVNQLWMMRKGKKLADYRVGSIVFAGVGTL